MGLGSIRRRLLAGSRGWSSESCLTAFGTLDARGVHTEQVCCEGSAALLAYFGMGIIGKGGRVNEGYMSTRYTTDGGDVERSTYACEGA